MLRRCQRRRPGTADPSANVFDGKLYIYPSHDRDIEIESNDNGDQYDMVDYHVFEMADMTRPPTDLGVALHVKDVAWASRQMWAPDAAQKNGTYYLYFPARDKDGLFRIGVAVSDTPGGPFSAQPNYIQGSFSIDPCLFTDDDGRSYLAFGGIWGGPARQVGVGVVRSERQGAGRQRAGRLPEDREAR